MKITWGEVMDFNEQKYLAEMQNLIETATDKFMDHKYDRMIYTISIWTDIDAAMSAINFDTFENSSVQVEFMNAFLKRECDKRLAQGDLEGANVLRSLPPQSRNVNPADFEWRELATIEHQCFGPDWDCKSEDECWDVLDPALLKVGALAKVAFSKLPLHLEAELSVNSRRDWYDQSWPLNGPDVSV